LSVPTTKKGKRTERTHPGKKRRRKAAQSDLEYTKLKKRKKKRPARGLQGEKRGSGFFWGGERGKKGKT